MKLPRTFVFVLAFLASTSLWARLTPGASVGTQQTMPIIADLDDNGLDDLIWNDAVWVNVDGRFTKQNLGIGEGWSVKDTLDLNGDGVRDLLASYRTPGSPFGAGGDESWRIYVASSALQYGSAIDVGTGQVTTVTGGKSFPYIADVNADGKDDLVMFRPYIVGGPTDMRYELTMRISRGDGTFDTRRPVEVPTHPQFGRYRRHIAAGDVDHDGVQDLVMRTVEELVVLHGRGAGDFKVKSYYFPTNLGGIDVMRLVDLDRDGHLDVVVAGGNREVRALFGDGKGRFTRVSSMTVTRTHEFHWPANYWPTPGVTQLLAGDQMSTRSIAVGEFVVKGRTELATAWPEGDIVVIAAVDGRLQEVSRTETDYLVPELETAALRAPGRTDLVQVFALIWGEPWPRPRMVYADPTAAAQSAVPLVGRRRASARSNATPEYTATISIESSCASIDAAPRSVESSGVFGENERGSELLQTTLMDNGTMYVRFKGAFSKWPAYGALRPVANGWTGSDKSLTACGEQAPVSFVVQRAE